MSVIVQGFQRISQSQQWNTWCTPDQLTVYQQTPGGIAGNLLSAYLDSLIPAFRTYYGYSFSPTSTNDSQDGIRFDLVLDPKSQGGAHTGTLFGQYGVSISPDAVINDFGGVKGFWFYLLAIHELANVWAGYRAHGWPWADGSPLWNGSPGSNFPGSGSPFPNMTDIVILGEIGRSDLSQIQQSRMTSDPAVMLLLSLQKFYGWSLFQKMFNYAKDNGISDWRTYDEPLRSAILIWFLSNGAGQTDGTGLLSQFNAMFQQYSGQTIPPSVYAQAQSKFPISAPSNSSNLWTSFWAEITSLLHF